MKDQQPDSGAKTRYPQIGTCRRCGKEFKKIRESHVFCSKSCNGAWRTIKATTQAPPTRYYSDTGKRLIGQ